MSAMRNFKLKNTLPLWGVLLVLMVFSCQDLNMEDHKMEDLSKLDQISSNVVPGKYIVTLHSNQINFRKSGKYEEVQAGMRKIVSDILIRYNIHPDKVDDVYGHAFEGFSVQMESFELKLLEQEPSIKQIIPDQYVIGHTNFKKGGNNGKGGGGGNDPAPEPEPDPEPEPEPDPIKQVEWYLDRIDQRALPLDGKFIAPKTGKGVTAYMIGAPILEGLDEFGGRASNEDLTGDGENTDLLMDFGVLNAAALGGKSYGVAKEVNIISLDVVGKGEATVSAYLKGMDHILAEGVKPAVIFLPLMGSDIDNELVESTINELYQEGYPIFTYGAFDEHVCNMVPAKFPTVFTVSSLGWDDAKAWISGYGSCIDLFAPGVAVLRGGFPEYPTDEFFDISYENAACLAAGVAALYLEDRPNATPQQVYDFLFETSTKDVVRFSNSINNHLLFSGLNDDGAGEIDPNRPDYAFDLEARAERTRGNNYNIIFEWSLIESETNRLNVYQDGEGIGSVVADQGFWMISESGKNIPPRTYKFCVPKSNLCSNEVIVTFN
ncbi:protease inhibitor I9 family protein [Cecembia lonarensis]|uniref:Aqualysin-1 n=1 Tax=Cecembia lonarensis (strain CCUG 58316 / KCTC 22772 / LW9) TaxID=1225176 RepID=K1KVT3_CECL9|nr:protease inhibitor I9 family protein [Cecembia lonarensis]EKB48235.1 Aqualysin-1 precursor [Cecembia lonarensis LW9]